MAIGGFLKNSFIDYPGKISCVIFLSGCNFDCPYCQVAILQEGKISAQEAYQNANNKNRFQAFLQKEKQAAAPQAAMPEQATT